MTRLFGIFARCFIVVVFAFASGGVCLAASADDYSDEPYESYESYYDDDPFIFSSFATEDDLPAGTISDQGALDFGTVLNLGLNSGAKYVAVADFDIAGALLGMPFESIRSLFFKGRSLYVPRKDNSIIYTMSREWKFSLDYECRQSGTVIPAELEKCINSLAKARGLLYPSELHLVRASTGETIDIYFTSNATGNRVWRVIYKNDVNEVEGSNEKFENQRNKKILVFWQGVLDKYGAPNSGNDKWVTSDNSYDPMMTAYYGMLDLVDQGAMADDTAKNTQSATEYFKAKPYAF